MGEQRDSLTEHLDFMDMVEEAKLMGYEEPRCANCRSATLVKGLPDHGLCRRQQQGPNHFAPIRAFELCDRWTPRYGILRSSPLLCEPNPPRAVPKPPPTTGPDGELEGW